MNKNDIIEIQIDSYGDKGEGVGRYDGLAVFVPFAIVGERVKARIILNKKTYAVGKLVEVLTPSSERVTPLCPYFTKCGGCQLMHMSESAQKSLKRKKVADAIKRIGKLDVNVDDVVCGENTLRYRNKLQMPLQGGESGLQGGFYAPFSHRLIAVNDCLIQTETSMKVFAALKEYADENGISGYCESTHTGLLRHLVLRSAESGLLITVVINGRKLPKIDRLIAKLEELNTPFGLYVNENTARTNVPFGDRFTHVCGLRELPLSDDGIKYSVLPQSFLQVNDEVKDRLYADSIAKVGIDGETTVINAYSGAGLLTAKLAKKAKRAIGVEIIPAATQNADRLKEENGVQNMKNITGDCAIEIPRIIKGITSEKTVLFLDPPRKGVDEKVLDATLDAEPEKIVYISCNPSTLARDLAILSKKYTVTSVTPYDMFPQTSHVETVVCLTKTAE